ncbi:CCR4-NOT transcription complex subunit 10 isoform X2 [Venturia canescens]|nr:CCR4-NOT transcription complex subunit 10 isoform X2 [Venturia canescens]XP_043279803.1 CCR4-NOT transcription complex subunit 10 isoform X2 [Venturia canescens]
MEESLAHKVCLLVIELHIATNRPDAALSIVNYVESQFISKESGKLGGPVEKDLGGIVPKTSTLKDHKEQKKESLDAATDAFRIQLLKYKARIYLLLQQPKLCKREWKTLMSLGAKVNLSTVFLKANLECAKGNHKKAIKLLNSVTNETLDVKTSGESAAVLYYNNMACIHQAHGKPNLAAFYLRKALEENQRAMDSVRTKDTESTSSQPLYTLNANKHHELMYNLGVSLLHAGQPMKAFDYLTEAAQRLQNRAQLWLRMAECCIQCHKPTNAVDFDIAKRREDLVQRVIGAGRHRKIILASALSKDTKYHTENLSYAIPQPTMEFAMLCLKNALFALPANDDESSSLPISCPVVSASTSVSMSLSGGLAAAAAAAAGPGGGNGSGVGADGPSQESPSTAQISTAWTQTLNLRIAVLAASAYVSLCLGDYLVALEHARSMLNIEKLPGAYKMLANLYAAESLILVDKMNEAIEHLKPQNIEDLNTGIQTPCVNDPMDKDKSEESMSSVSSDWFPSSLQTAKSIIKYNLAVAYAIRGELNKSGEILKQVWLSKGPNCDVPIHVIMLALYIELQLGHADVSRSIVKQHCPQYW